MPIGNPRFVWIKKIEPADCALLETVERTFGLLAAVGRSRFNQGGELGTQFKIEFQQFRLGNGCFNPCRIVAQTIEVSHDAGQVALSVLDLPDPGTVEGHHLLRHAGVQQVEGGGQVTAQAVTGNGQWTVNQAPLAQRGVPVLHIVDLAEGPAERLDLHGIGRLVVAGGIVEKFGGAKAHDQFTRLGTCNRVILDALEQSAGEAGTGIG
ncbi:hypothetical protein BZL42_09600 [Pseudomonas indica]|nr:hypothetical protein BZL42_09600 [Pseudomonas indica]